MKAVNDFGVYPFLFYISVFFIENVVAFKFCSTYSSFRKIFGKTNISFSMIYTRICVYQGVRYASFLENFA